MAVGLTQSHWIVPFDAVVSGESRQYETRSDAAHVGIQFFMIGHSVGVGDDMIDTQSTGRLGMLQQSSQQISTDLRGLPGLSLSATI